MIKFSLIEKSTMTKKMFDEIINRIYPIRSEIDEFDCGYGKLPKKISNKLSSEAVDAMQHILCNLYCTKRQFAKAYKDKLFELGEIIK